MAACVSSLDLLCNFRRCRSINSSDPSKTIPLLSATVNCSGVRSIAACKLRNVLAKSGASSGAEKFEEDEGSSIDEDPVRKKVTSIISKFQNGAFANIPFVPGFSISFSAMVGDRIKEVEEQDDMIHKQKQVMSIKPKFRKRRRAFRHFNYRLGQSILYSDLVRECLKDFVEVEEKDDSFFDDYSTSASSIHKQAGGVIQERDFAGTPYVPIYVNLPLGVINMDCELVNADDLKNQLRILKSINVDGVKVNCWWGIVEAHASQQYNWGGYKKLFEIVRDLKFKLQVIMSFHECGGNADDACISLPQWVIEIGNENPDIFFTDREGRRNHECLTWGIDEECVLAGRTAVEVYFDYMKSFRAEFDEFFEDGVICEIEIGLGPCGELRYPSCPAKYGWKYPGIGEFQCYDKYMIKNLEKATKRKFWPWITGPDCPCSYIPEESISDKTKNPLSFWGTPPDSAGSYNSTPHETRFFCDGGGFYSHYGRFFLSWYSQFLVDHGDRVLTMANIALKGTSIVAKLPCIYWWYKTASHAAEVTAGFYNFAAINGYLPIAMMLKIHETALNLTCIELRTSDQLKDFPEASADPEKLVRKVLNAAWGVGIPAASENVRPCYNREGYNTILENAKPLDRPDGRHIYSFTYHQLSPELMQEDNFTEFERFVKRMHGESVPDLGSRGKEEARTLDE